MMPPPADNCLVRAAAFLTGVDAATLPEPIGRPTGWLEGWRSALQARSGIYALRLDASDVPPHHDLEWLAIVKAGDDLHAVACRGGSVLFDLAGGPSDLDLSKVTHGLILVRTT
jgi:hypothetical protein